MEGRTRLSPWIGVCLFVALTVGFGLPFEGLMIHAGRSDMARGYVVTGQMWTPGLAALISCLLLGLHVRGLGFTLPRRRYLAIGYLIPVIYASAAYLTLWTTGLAPSQLRTFEHAAEHDLDLGQWAGLYMVALVATIGVLRACTSAAGEEIGWRGFLVPMLASRLPFAGIVAVSGFIWAIWHIPAMLFEGYTSGAPTVIAISCFSVQIFSTAGIAAWLRLRSGSVWPSVLLHGCHNAFIQLLFDPMTVETGRSALFATEFGLAIAATSAAMFIGLLFWGGVPDPRLACDDRAIRASVFDPSATKS